jgi:hypothetical protein
MSRSGFYYAVKTMERTAAGTAAAGVPRAPARQGADREAAAAARPAGSAASLIRRVLAAVQRSVGAAPGTAVRGRRRLGGAARPGA